MYEIKLANEDKKLHFETHSPVLLSLHKDNELEMPFAIKSYDHLTSEWRIENGNTIRLTKLLI